MTTKPKRKPRGATKRRIAIIFDGKAWYVRRIAVIMHDIPHDLMIYHCDQPISNDHATLADVPQVEAILRLALKKKEGKR